MRRDIPLVHYKKIHDTIKKKLERTIKSGNCDNGNNTENGDGEKEKQTRLKGM